MSFLFPLQKFRSSIPKEPVKEQIDEEDAKAIVPPLETFFRVETDDRARHFFDTIQPQDLLLCRVKEKTRDFTTFFYVRLLYCGFGSDLGCDQKCARYLAELLRICSGIWKVKIYSRFEDQVFLSLRRTFASCSTLRWWRRGLRFCAGSQEGKSKAFGRHETRCCEE